MPKRHHRRPFQPCWTGRTSAPGGLPVDLICTSPPPRVSVAIPGKHWRASVGFLMRPFVSPVSLGHLPHHRIAWFRNGGVEPTTPPGSAPRFGGAVIHTVSWFFSAVAPQTIPHSPLALVRNPRGFTKRRDVSRHPGESRSGQWNVSMWNGLPHAGSPCPGSRRYFFTATILSARFNTEEQDREWWGHCSLGADRQWSWDGTLRDRGTRPDPLDDTRWPPSLVGGTVRLHVILGFSQVHHCSATGNGQL